MADRDCRPLFRTSVVVPWDVDPADYYADTIRASRSGLEVVRKSPHLYEAQRLSLDNDESIAPDDTAALRRGRALHIAVLQPDLYAGLVRVLPSMRPSKALDAVKASLPRCGVIITAEQARQVAGMAAAVLRHPLVSDWLSRESGQAEAAFEWVDDESSVPCKMMVDHHFLTHGRDALRIWDLKSTEDPSPAAFTKSVVNFGYHRQEAWYSDALQRVYPELPLRYFIVAVRAKPPHEVGIFELDETFRAPARAQVRTGLRAFAEHRERNDWRAPWELTSTTKPFRLTAPRWAQEEA